MRLFTRKGKNMYIVRLKNNEKHSAWNTEAEANNQIKVLHSYGYRACFWEELNCDYINGHYFV